MSKSIDKLSFVDIYWRHLFRKTSCFWQNFGDLIVSLNFITNTKLQYRYCKLSIFPGYFKKQKCYPEISDVVFLILLLPSCNLDQKQHIDNTLELEIFHCLWNCDSVTSPHRHPLESDQLSLIEFFHIHFLTNKLLCHSG